MAETRDSFSNTTLFILRELKTRSVTYVVQSTDHFIYLCVPQPRAWHTLELNAFLWRGRGGQKPNWGRKIDSKDSTRALVRVGGLVGRLEASWGECVSTGFQSRQCCISQAPRASAEHEVRQEVGQGSATWMAEERPGAGPGSGSWEEVEVKTEGHMRTWRRLGTNLTTPASCSVPRFCIVSAIRVSSAWPEGPGQQISGPKHTAYDFKKSGGFFAIIS